MSSARRQDLSAATAKNRSAYEHGREAFSVAQRKARYGHRDWIWWSDDVGSHAAPKTADSLKTALLAVGTKGKWSLICADTGIPVKGFWRLGINMIRQMRLGYC
jgi:hypothetical protein